MLYRNQRQSGASCLVEHRDPEKLWLENWGYCISEPGVIQITPKKGPAVSITPSSWQYQRQVQWEVLCNQNHIKVYRKTKLEVLRCQYTTERPAPQIIIRKDSSASQHSFTSWAESIILDYRLVRLRINSLARVSSLQINNSESRLR